MSLADLVPTSARALGMCRAGVFGFLAAQLALTDFAALGRLPTTLMHPPGLMEYFSWKFYDRLLTPGGMVGFQVLLVASLAVASAGLRTSVTAKLGAALYLFYQGVLRSFGHFNHDEMVAVWCVVVLAFTPCGDGFSLDSRRRSVPPPNPVAYGYPILLMRCVLAWAYFSSALLKLRVGGVAWLSQESLLTLMAHNSLGNLHDTQSRVVFWLAERPWLMAAAPGAALAWELAFPLAIVSRRLRPWLLALGVCFHVTTLLAMNITFPVQLAMYLLFVDWDRLAARSASRSSHHPPILAHQSDSRAELSAPGAVTTREELRA